MIRKYMTEFGLHVSTAYKTIVPVEHLAEIKDGHKYHIYFITSCPKVIIESGSIQKTPGEIKLDMKKIENGQEIIIFDNVICIHPTLNHEAFEVECLYPYTELNIKIVDEYNKNILRNLIGESDKEYYELIIESQAILNNQEHYTNFDLEVLYIGQAYGKNGERLAQERLESHSTLQKIITDCYSRFPDKRIYILLLEINTGLAMLADGRSKQFLTNSEENDSHLEAVIKNKPKENQIINITEAALINYFKPKYNTNFVNNFPDINHKGYKQYFDLDYNHLTVELDLEFQRIPGVRLYTQENKINSSWDFIEYDLFNDPDRASMCDIFIVKK